MYQSSLFPAHVSDNRSSINLCWKSHFYAKNLFMFPYNFRKDMPLGCNASSFCQISVTLMAPFLRHLVMGAWGCPFIWRDEKLNSLFGFLPRIWSSWPTVSSDFYFQGFHELEKQQVIPVLKFPLMNKWLFLFLSLFCHLKGHAVSYLLLSVQSRFLHSSL